MAEYGDEIGEGMGDIQREALKWKRRWEAVKRVTMKTQQAANPIFYETLFLDIPAEGHLVAGLYMALSSLADFVADVGLFIDYWDTYAEIRPFGSSGVLGKGLIQYSELENVRREMHSMAEQIANRAPMDLWYYVSIGHDVTQAVKQYKMKKRFETVAAQTKVDISQIDADMARLAAAYEQVGLPPQVVMSPEIFKKLYKVRATELFPKRNKDSNAKDELKLWGAANKETRGFQKKYGALFSALNGNNPGNNQGNGPDDDDKKKDEPSTPSTPAKSPDTKESQDSPATDDKPGSNN
jgi:hypothetical protein